MALTYEEKQDIADTIKVIFKGAVPATPNQITDEVADMVTKIINEIAVCSKRIEKNVDYNSANSIHGISDSNSYRESWEKKP